MVHISLTLLTQTTAKKVRRKFLDSLRLCVKGGSGGTGYPKYGGIGGAGGDVYFVGKEETTLKAVITKNPTKRIVAKHGENSHAKRILGSKGDDIKINIPLGVTVIDETGKKIGDINKDGEELLVAKGAIGGCEETGFSGRPAISSMVTLDLKLIADVGLVGFPNAGKSTLLSIISKANPKIASYPFTTIQPQLGTIEFPDLRKLTVADLPGLIEGAHANVGMGHKFLKHVERTKLLLMVVDITGFRLGVMHELRSCLETIILLNRELELYKEELLNKPIVLLINKMDLPSAEKTYHEIKDCLNHLEALYTEIPESLRPKRPIEFSRILAISAMNKEASDVDKVKNCLREVIDEYYKDSDVEEEIILAKKIDSKYRVHGPRVL